MSAMQVKSPPVEQPAGMVSLTGTPNPPHELEVAYTLLEVAMEPSAFCVQSDLNDLKGIVTLREGGISGIWMHFPIGMKACAVRPVAQFTTSV
jgi:hypothetical protein